MDKFDESRSDRILLKYPCEHLKSSSSGIEYAPCLHEGHRIEVKELLVNYALIFIMLSNVTYFFEIKS